MLPEFLDDQAQLKSAIVLPSSDALQSLQSWLVTKEAESNRQIRPAWMEIAWALIHLVQQRFADAKPEPESFIFETHIVARQCARQRSERQLPTRFVTDEIKRISNHQLDFLNSIKDPKHIVAVIGWYRLPNRRGLGIAMMEKSAALEICSEALSQENQTELDEYERETGSRRQANVLRGPYYAVSLLLVFLCIVLVLFGYRHLLRPDSTDTHILASIKANNLLRCGVDGLLPHFSLLNDAEQTWWGLDVELCKALGAALDVQVEFVKVSASPFEQRISALQNRQVDILFRNTSHTITRDLHDDIMFGPVYFYESEYFLDFISGAENSAVKLSDLTGKKVCVKPGTSNERTLQSVKQDADFKIITQDVNRAELSDNIKLLRALREQEDLCDFAFGNYFVLKQLKNDQERRHPEKVLSLRPFEKLGLDPLAPVLLRDHQWQRVVNYTLYAVFYAEQLNITSYNLEQKYNHGNAMEKQFLRGAGMEDAGLNGEWVYRIINEVGNYGELYYRSIVCDYVACEMPTEQAFKEFLAASEDVRWPNKVFKPNTGKPGMLVTPRF